MAELMALHEKFARQGLVIIVVQPDKGVPRSRMWQARATRRPEWGDRELPFRVALDGGGPTAIAGTDAHGPWPDVRRLRRAGESAGRSTPPVNLLDRPRRHGARGVRPTVRSLESELETRMGVKAKVPALARPFRPALLRSPMDRSSNASGRHILPSGHDYLFSTSRGVSQTGPDRSEVFRWDGRLRHWGTMGCIDLQDVLGFVLKFRRGEFDGPAELLNKPIPGDWIVRQGAATGRSLEGARERSWR